MSYKKLEDMKKEEEIKSLKNERKYSKKAFVYGMIGMGAIGLVSFFSDHMSLEYLSKEVGDLNKYETINSIILGLSFMTTLTGGTMYGISYLFDNDSNFEGERKKKNLEKDLED